LTEGDVAVKYKIRKGDPVVVIAGRDKLTVVRNTKFKGAKVKSVIIAKGKVVVESVNMVKRHFRQSQAHPEGGIVEKEMPIDISNVMYYCSKCDKGVRLGVKELEGGKRVRYCKACGEIVDKD
jgi:large subunit ribosomal protein L24